MFSSIFLKMNNVEEHQKEKKKSKSKILKPYIFTYSVKRTLPDKENVRFFQHVKVNWEAFGLYSLQISLFFHTGNEELTF